MRGKGVYGSQNGLEDSLDMYLREISEQPLLAPNEEVLLAERIRKGDDTALERLTKANLRFVVSVAKQYQSQGLSLGDIINAGNLGLIKAATRFDETRGFKFISYAVWWIRQSILQALAEQSRIVRLPLNRIGALHKIEKIVATLEQEYKREPSASEIAEILNMNPSDVSDAIRTSNTHLSIDAPFNLEEENRLVDLLQSDEEPPPDKRLLDESLKIEIRRTLSSLEGKEAKVLTMYFGLDQENPLTLEEIGERFKLTRERVRQIKEKALRRLRHTSRSNILRKYLG